MAGERLEKKCSRKNTAFWLSVLALLPAQLLLLFFLCQWIEKFLGYGLDSYLNVFLFILLLVVIMWASLIMAIRIFFSWPYWLIPIGLASWCGAMWLILLR